MKTLFSILHLESGGTDTRCFTKCATVCGSCSRIRRSREILAEPVALSGLIEAAGGTIWLSSTQTSVPESVKSKQRSRYWDSLRLPGHRLQHEPRRSLRRRSRAVTLASRVRVAQRDVSIICGLHFYMLDANIGNWPRVLRAARNLDVEIVLPGHYLDYN